MRRGGPTKQKGGGSGEEGRRHSRGGGGGGRGRDKLMLQLLLFGLVSVGARIARGGRGD